LHFTFNEILNVFKLNLNLKSEPFDFYYALKKLKLGYDFGNRVAIHLALGMLRSIRLNNQNKSTF